MKRIEFFFDFVSPFAYLAFERLPQALEGQSYAVDYRPVLFAGLLQHWGQKGPAEIESKRAWTFRHVHWLAAQQGTPMQTPADTLSGLSGVPRGAGPVRSGDVLYYRCYLTDRSRNLKSVPVVIGDPTKPWAYTVEPGERLYPNKRLIIRTDRA